MALSFTSGGNWAAYTPTPPRTVPAIHDPELDTPKESKVRFELGVSSN